MVLGKWTSLVTGRPASPAETTLAETSASADVAVFTPGARFAERYRIISLVGRGGMGVVYRADDLKLRQTVALKFLPTSLSSDPWYQEQFLNEVRLAREVTHPNICRVYDVGESDGWSFLTMEYVDGEDLASLLRRIGSLPLAKGLDVARQVCAGLAAAHAAGIIHRDLKPANIMLDGRGRVRITDFGLACLLKSEVGERVAGSLPYMAPELAEGLPPTVRSDLFSLGVVLYEELVGHRPFEIRSLPDYRHVDPDRIPSPATQVHGLAPEVETAILRCLSWDPALRPVSAADVASTLPGHDPLAAAVAEGETPSPGLVAASGETVRLSAMATGSLVGVACVAVLAIALLTSRTHLLALAPSEKPPQVLEDRARQILAQTGIAGPRAKTAMGFTKDGELLKFVSLRDASSHRWSFLETGRPPALRFWYRQSPTTTPGGAFEKPPSDSSLDPSEAVGGTGQVVLDTDGRLLELLVVPPAALGLSPSRATHWSGLFQAADLDSNRFRPVRPLSKPTLLVDEQRAWIGETPGMPGVPLRVEGWSLRGVPVAFRTSGEWRNLKTSRTPLETALHMTSMTVQTFATVAVLMAAIVSAWRNLRLGRGDRRGALKVSVFLFWMSLAAGLLKRGIPVALEEVRPWIVQVLAPALSLGLVVWILYLALEPTIRRRWPELLITWNRVLEGRRRDAQVGRDMLIGLAAGCAVALLIPLYQVIPPLFGFPPPGPHWDNNLGSALLGVPQAAALALNVVQDAILRAALWIGLLVGFQVAFRNRTLATVSLAIVIILGRASASGGDLGFLIGVETVIAVVEAVVLARFGLLCFIFYAVTMEELLRFPVTLDVSRWYAETAIPALILLLLTAVVGVRSVLGRKTASIPAPA